CILPARQRERIAWVLIRWLAIASGNSRRHFGTPAVHYRGNSLLQWVSSSPRSTSKLGAATDSVACIVGRMAARLLRIFAQTRFLISRCSDRWLRLISTTARKACHGFARL